MHVDVLEIEDTESEHEFPDVVLRRLEQEDAVPLGGSQDDTSWSSSRGRHLTDDDGGELDLKMMSEVMEVHEDDYILGGMWYLNNWILTSKMTAEQWVYSTVGVGHEKRCQTLHDLQNSLAKPKPNPGLGFKNVSQIRFYTLLGHNLILVEGLKWTFVLVLI